MPASTMSAAPIPPIQTHVGTPSLPALVSSFVSVPAASDELDVPLGWLGAVSPSEGLVDELLDEEGCDVEDDVLGSAALEDEGAGAELVDELLGSVLGAALELGESEEVGEDEGVEDGAPAPVSPLGGA